MARAKGKKARRKPMFGPPVTPEIFNSKWQEKFATFGKEYGSPTELPLDLKEEEDMLTIVVNRLEKAVELVHFCGREARTLDLGFPCAMREVKGDDMIIIESAMATLHFQRYEVQHMLNTFQDNKNGKLLHGRFRWQELSLPLRKRINNLFDAVEDEKKMGMWNIDERAARSFEAELTRLLSLR